MSHRVFNEATVNVIKEYVLQKFPSLGKKKSYDYDSLRRCGYLKANENQDASARTDPESCVRGND